MDTMKTEISIDLARRLAIFSQGYDNQWKNPHGKEGAANVVERLGFIQIDTLQVVQRAHHHILWSRQSDYIPGMIEELHWPDRRVFESFFGIACYFPINDLRFYFPDITSLTSELSPDAWFNHVYRWYKENKALCESILKRIKDEGPLGSLDFSRNYAKKSHAGKWWNWNPSKRALETLHSMGLLMIRERKKFKRIYDLPERIIPANINTAKPEGKDIAHYFLTRNLGLLGIATEEDMLQRIKDTNTLQSVLHEAIEEGKLIPLSIHGLKDIHYVRSDLFKCINNSKYPSKDVKILSPFDPLVLWKGGRSRLKRYFNISYKLGCYTQAVKRRWGYFGLPILWGNRIVGYIDSKADRKKGILYILTVNIEKYINEQNQFTIKFLKELNKYRLFNCCNSIVFKEIQPKWLKKKLQVVKRCQA